MWAQGEPALHGQPYGLWRELVRGLLEQGQYAPELHCALAPVLGQPLVSSHQPDMILRAPAFDQMQVWEGVASLLHFLLQTGPKLLILDSCEGCDSLSQDLLRFLARAFAEYPLLIIATVRESEQASPTSQNVQRLFAPLIQEQVAQVMPVSPLSSLSCERLLRTLDAHLPPAQISRLAGMAAGNPFYCEQLVAHLQREEANAPGKRLADSAERLLSSLPSTLSAVLEARFTMVSQGCAQVLSAACVLGGVWAFDTLAQLLKGDEEEQLCGLEEALARGLLREDVRGVDVFYLFSHPLLEAHLSARLDPHVRKTLHGEAARLFQERYRGREEEGAALIVYHLSHGQAEAHLVAQFAVLAGSHAYRLFAYPEAEHFYRLALQAGEAGAPLSAWEQLCLLDLLGECAMVQGKYEAAAACYSRVLDVLQVPPFVGASWCQWQALLWRERGMAYCYLGKPEQAWTCLKAGLDCLDTAGIRSGPAWATLQSFLAHLLRMEGQLDAAIQSGKLALSAYEEDAASTPVVVEEASVLKETGVSLSRTRRTLAGNAVDRGRACLFLAGLLAARGQNHQESILHLLTAVHIFEAVQGCRREQVRAWSNLGDLYLREGEFEQAKHYLLQARSLAERIGAAPSQAVCLGNIGLLATRRGDLCEAGRALSDAIFLAERVHEPEYHSIFLSLLATVCFEQGNRREATSCLRSAYRMGRNIPSCVSLALVKLAGMRLMQVQLHGEEIVLPGGQCECQACQRLVTETLLLLEKVLDLRGIEAETRLEGLLLRAQAHLLLRQFEQASNDTFQASEEMTRHGLLVFEPFCARLTALLHEAYGRSNEAEAGLWDSSQRFRRIGMQLEEARTLRLFGMLLLWRTEAEDESGRRRQGGEVLERAAFLFRACQAALDQAHLQRLQGEERS